jgi:CDP-glucose 4,6-dehydratase
VTSSYWNSFLKERGIAVTTCRAGNVIGGGDFAADRIIPDCIRAAQSGADIVVRNPFSVRPYQHVLEPVAAYLMIAQAQYENPGLSGSYNIGPNETDCWSTGELVDLFCREWKKQTGNDQKWINQYDGGPHEAAFLKLDCAKLKRVFGWQPVWNVETAMEKIVEWSWAYVRNEDVAACMERQIREYLDRF